MGEYVLIRVRTRIDMAAYISAKFEKDDLPTVGQIRVIVRNVDQGAVPPDPTATYLPTHPDDFQTFVVGEYVDDTQGERFVKVADLSELSSLTYSELNIFEDPAGNLGAAVAGDVIEITLTPTELWVSEEYPSSVFQFVVAAPIDAFNVEIENAFPDFRTALTWEASHVGISFATGSQGITRRENLTYPGGVQQFLEKRFNAIFDSAVESENFTAATQAEMTALANESQGVTVVDETFTAEPTV